MHCRSRLRRSTRSRRPLRARRSRGRVSGSLFVNDGARSREDALEGKAVETAVKSSADRKQQKKRTTKMSQNRASFFGAACCSLTTVGACERSAPAECEGECSECFECVEGGGEGRESEVGESSGADMVGSGRVGSKAEEDGVEKREQEAEPLRPCEVVHRQRSHQDLALGESGWPFGATIGPAEMGVLEKADWPRAREPELRHTVSRRRSVALPESAGGREEEEAEAERRTSRRPLRGIGLSARARSKRFVAGLSARRRWAEAHEAAYALHRLRAVHHVVSLSLTLRTNLRTSASRFFLSPPVRSSM